MWRVGGLFGVGFAGCVVVVLVLWWCWGVAVFLLVCALVGVSWLM